MQQYRPETTKVTSFLTCGFSQEACGNTVRAQDGTFRLQAYHLKERKACKPPKSEYDLTHIQNPSILNSSNRGFASLGTNLGQTIQIRLAGEFRPCLASVLAHLHVAMDASMVCNRTTQCHRV